MPPHQRTGAIASAGMAVAALLLVGCADAREAQARAAADAFAGALAAGQLEVACGLLAPATRERLERSGRCTDALARTPLPHEPPAVDVRVWGQESQVRTPTDTIFLTATENGWKVSAAGCTPRGQAPYACVLEGP